MVDKKSSNMENAVNLQDRLADKITLVRQKRDAVLQSMERYKKNHVIDPAFFPGDVKRVDKILKRFYKANNIKDFYDLVTNAEMKILGAMNYVREDYDPQGEHAMVYKELKNIRDNIELLQELKKDPNNEKSKDGIEILEEYVVIIKEFIQEFAEFLSLAGAKQADSHKLPNDLDQLKGALKLTVPSNAHQDKKTIKAGGEEDIAKIREVARLLIEGELTLTKLACITPALEKEIEFAKCGVIEKAEGKREACLKFKDEADNIMANCDSHFPMVSLSDRLIKSVRDNIGEVEYVIDESQALTLYTGIKLDNTKNALNLFKSVVNANEQQQTAMMTISGFAPTPAHRESIEKIYKTISDSNIKSHNTVSQIEEKLFLIDGNTNPDQCSGDTCPNMLTEQ